MQLRSSTMQARGSSAVPSTVPVSSAGPSVVPVPSAAVHSSPRDTEEGVIWMAKVIWTPRTTTDLSVLIALADRADALGLTWLKIAVIYRSLQVSLKLVVDSVTKPLSQKVDFAKTMKNVVANNFSGLDAAYVRAEAQISALKEPTRSYALSVFPHKFAFADQQALCDREASDYIQRNS